MVSNFTWACSAFYIICFEGGRPVPQFIHTYIHTYVIIFLQSSQTLIIKNNTHTNRNLNNQTVNLNQSKLKLSKIEATQTRQYEAWEYQWRVTFTYTHSTHACIFPLKGKVIVDLHTCVSGVWVCVCAQHIFWECLYAFMKSVIGTRICTKICLFLNICCDTERKDEWMEKLLLLLAHSAY